MSDNANPPKKRGCFFYGCLTLAIVVVLLMIGAYFSVQYGIRKINKWSEQYTETTPVVLEKTELPPAELTILQARVQAFGDALTQQKGTQELVLTARDLNALIGSDPNFKALRDKVFVIIEGDRISGKISLPLKDIGPFKLKGRYLNGMAVFKVSLAGGHLWVTLQDVQVKGAPLPGTVLSQFKQINLAQDAQNDPKTRDSLEKFDSIQVTNGSVILRNKPKE